MKKLKELSLPDGEEALARNLVDVMKEQQVKLGYREELVRLYYPASSLNHLLGTSYGTEDLKGYLEEFAERAEECLGLIRVSYSGDRFCLAIPPQGAAYAYSELTPEDFLYEFIGAVQKHGVTIEEIRAIFEKQSDCVHFERIEGGEFDYLLYFEDGIPDDYYYCLTDEGIHFIYHRFTKADYEEFGF